MINTRRILAVTSLSVLVLGIAACSPKGATPEQGSTTSSASPSASASQSGMPAQSGASPQSGVPNEGNQAPEVNVADNDQRCDLSNLQASLGSRQEIGSTTYVEGTFTNEGSSCWISGFPQVLFASGGATVSEAAPTPTAMRTTGPMRLNRLVSRMQNTAAMPRMMIVSTDMESL